MCHDWPVENATVIFPIKMKGNLKCTSGNSLSPLGPRTWILVLLTEDKLNLYNKLTMCKNGTPYQFYKCKQLVHA